MGIRVDVSKKWNAELGKNRGKWENTKWEQKIEWVNLRGGGGGSLGISGWECADGTLEPLTYTRASSTGFCYPILE